MTSANEISLKISGTVLNYKDEEEMEMDETEKEEEDAEELEADEIEEGTESY